MRGKWFIFAVVFGLLSTAYFAYLQVQASAVDAPADAEVTVEDCYAGVSQIRSMPNYRARTNETGIFRKPKPEEPSPNDPQTPVDPPAFEFPGGVPGDSESVDETGFKDWEPEQWKAFFDTLMSFITAIAGLFGGFSAQRAGGILKAIDGLFKSK
jgi:hypothetical protein